MCYASRADKQWSLYLNWAINQWKAFTFWEQGVKNENGYYNSYEKTRNIVNNKFFICKKQNNKPYYEIRKKKYRNVRKKAIFKSMKLFVENWIA